MNEMAHSVNDKCDTNSSIRFSSWRSDSSTYNIEEFFILRVCISRLNTCMGNVNAFIDEIELLSEVEDLKLKLPFF